MTSLSDLKSLTNKILDEEVELMNDDGTSTKITRREALITRIITDAIGDEDPAIRGKASALVLELIDYDADRKSKMPDREEIVNKKGQKYERRT